MPHIVALAGRMEFVVCAATLFEAHLCRVHELLGRHKQRGRCRCTLFITELTNVDGDVSGVDPGLKLAHLGMVPPPPEQPWWLHSEVAHLNSIQSHLIDMRYAVASCSQRLG